MDDKQFDCQVKELFFPLPTALINVEHVAMDFVVNITIALETGSLLGITSRGFAGINWNSVNIFAVDAGFFATVNHPRRTVTRSSWSTWTGGNTAGPADAKEMSHQTHNRPD